MANPALKPGALLKANMVSKADAKATRDRLRQKVDRAENAKVKARSGGQCEVWRAYISVDPDYQDAYVRARCQRNATQVHHQIGGNGKRARGKSLLAEHKQHVCDQCHRDVGGDIGGKRLVRIGDMVPHYTDVYVRAK